MRLTRANFTAVAVFMALCVILLGLAAASPLVHRSICAEAHGSAQIDTGHHHDAPAPHNHDLPDDGDRTGGDHICAVTLFASGCETIAFYSAGPPVSLTADETVRFIDFLFSRTLLGPERVCGPPARA